MLYTLAMGVRRKEPFTLSGLNVKRAERTTAALSLGRHACVPGS